MELEVHNVLPICRRHSRVHIVESAVEAALRATKKICGWFNLLGGFGHKGLYSVKKRRPRRNY